MSQVVELLADSEKHLEDCHKRWLEIRNRKQESPDYRDEWYGEQCGACRYFVRLSGAFTDDYGGCTNASSPFDARIMFEHDGCEQFEYDEMMDDLVPEAFTLG